MVCVSRLILITEKSTNNDEKKKIIGKHKFKQRKK